MGEDKKTLTVFSSLAQNSVKFFHKRASQGLFRCFLPLRRDTPLKMQKRRQDFSCRYINAPENAIMQIIVLPCHRDLLQEILGLYIKKFRFFFKL